MYIHEAKELKAKLNSLLEAMCQAQESGPQPGPCTSKALPRTDSKSLSTRAISTERSTGDTEELVLEESLSPGDVILIGLGLCRLRTAAIDYIQADGEDEEDTFPCGDEDDDVQENITRVKDVLSRTEELVEVFRKLLVHMLGSEIRDFVKAAELRAFCQEFLGASK